MTNGQQKSDGRVVPAKAPNKVESSTAEVLEGRRPVSGNASQQNALRTQSRQGALSALARVREAAKRNKKAKMTALMHHITLEALRAAYDGLRKQAAAGVDGVTWSQYGENLEERLRDLHARLRRGAYRARPSRRVYIPKADGKERPLGVASLEDKLVQRAVVRVLNAVYEVDFLGFSYGFRPGRDQHRALDALSTGIRRKKVNWVLDADIRGFFESLDHGWLMKFLEHRVADKGMLRLIQKWLRAGVLESGVLAQSEQGTPQGATVSPLLANIYLHYVMDLWVEQWRKSKAHGDIIVVRYADDFVVGFQHRADAERFLAQLRERLDHFALELHPEKTRLIRFGAYAAAQRKELGERKPETFNFLGFTHVCSKSRSGKFLLLRQTMAVRTRRKLQDIGVELRRRWHLSAAEQGEWLARVLRGFYAYHAVPMNTRRLVGFRRQVVIRWYSALRRRSQRDRTTWERINRLAQRWLPLPHVLHPWPEERFDRFHVTTADKSPVR